MNIHNVVYPYNRIVSPDKKKKEHSAPTYYNVNKFQKKNIMFSERRQTQKNILCIILLYIEFPECANP